MAVPPKAGKFIYHLTCIDNFDSIIKHGLYPRSSAPLFVDIADQEIIAHRQDYGLNDYIPFHFFAGNPFDGKVQSDHPDKEYILLAIYRKNAQANNFKILPIHPVHFMNNYQNKFPQCFADGKIIPLDYEEGMAAIDWDTMSIRDYSNEYCKMVCMAECLCKPKKSCIPITAIDHIYVPDENIYNTVVASLKKYGYTTRDFVITTNSKMFKSRGNDDDPDSNRRYIEI